MRKTSSLLLLSLITSLSYGAIAPLGLTVNGQNQIEINCEIENETEIHKIIFNQEINELKNLLDPSTYQKLLDLNTKGYVTPNELSSIGIVVDYDIKELLINLRVPLKNTNKLNFSMGGTGHLPEETEPILPEKFNTFINFRNNQKIDQNANSTFRSMMEGNINFKSWTLETNHEYSNNNWTRGDSRINYDNTKYMTRVSIGDVQIPINSFMSSRPLGGISIVRESTLAPYKTTTPINEKEFIIKNKSEVSIYVNNQLTQFISMLPGRYNLTELPVNTGLNEIKLLIKDEFGQIETIVFPYLGNNQLLKIGHHHYEFVVGKSVNTSNGTKSYGQDQTGNTISAIDYIGLTNQFTQGVFFQKDNLQSIFGLDAIYSSRLGNFQLETGYSSIKAGKTGYALRPSYSFTNSKNSEEREWSFNLSSTFYSQFFAQLGNITPNNIYTKIYQTGFSKRINDLISANFNFSFSQPSDTVSHPLYKYDVGTSLSIVKGLSVSASYTREQTSSGLWNSTYLAFLNYVFDNPHYGATSSYNSMTQEKRINARAEIDTDKSTLSSNANLADSPNNESMSAGVGFNHHRFTIDTTVDHIKSKSNIDKVNRTNLSTNLNFALSFTGNNFAISRPITASYAMIVPNQNLKSQIVSINPDQNGNATTDRLGNLIVPHLTPYQYNSLNVDSSKLEEGFSAGPEYYNLLPGYKTAHLIHIGQDNQIAITGQLKSKKGEPIKLETGVAKCQKSETDFFTNQTGQFFIENIPSGKCKLIIGELQSKEIEIKSQQSGKINLNEVVLE